MSATIDGYDGALDGRVRAWAMPFSAEYASDELLAAAKGLADSRGTGLTLHHSTGPRAIAASISEHGVTPTERLERLGVLGENVTLAHGLGLNDAELDSIARTGARVVMCPTAAIKGGSGMTRTAKLPEMLERGISVGLGTDAGNNSNLLETMRSMYLAAVLYKDGREDVSMIPAETAAELATLGSAHAMGLGRRRRLDRGGQEGGPGVVRHAPPGVANAVQSGEQPGLRRGWAQRPHRHSGRPRGGGRPPADCSWTSGS